MQRHFSIGVTTIVALMAAHRAAAGREGAPVTYNQAEIGRISAYLHGDSPPASKNDSPRHDHVLARSA